MGTAPMRRLFLACLLSTAALQVGCSGLTSAGSSKLSSSPTGSNPTASVTVTVTPNSTNVRAGAAQAFGATVSGSSNTAVSWQVNGVTGGGTSTGTISASGAYTAPPSLPSPNTVTVRAVSAA